jgi:hypothetical protein
MGWQLVTVNASDVTDVAVTTLPGSAIAGRVVFENGEAPAAREMDLTITAADPDQTPFVGAASRADIHDDWTFRSPTSSAGPLRVARAPAGWAASRVIVNGLDAVDGYAVRRRAIAEDVQILMTNRITRLTGTVVDAARRGRLQRRSRSLVSGLEVSRWRARRRPAGSPSGLPAAPTS